MKAPAEKLMTQPLRIAVLAADPARVSSLSRLVRELGHLVAQPNDASLVLIDGVAILTTLPTLALGIDSDDYQGRLPLDASAAQIDAALRGVAAGLTVSLADDLGRKFAALHEDDERILLSPRETEVLAAVANGLTNKEIALGLGISRHTVKFHLESLMRKLGVSSRAEAVAKSMRFKLLEPYRL
jgi:DNA-binding NarL/FixJ family response regulator